MRKKTIGEKWGRKRLKKGVRYQSVSLSAPFIQLVKEHIKDDPMYRSIADYVRESIREKMNRENINPDIPPGIGRLVDILDELKDFANLLSPNDERFGDFSGYINDFYNESLSKLRTFGYDIDNVEIDPEVANLIRSAASERGLSAHDYLEGLIQKDLKSKNKKVEKNNFRG